jgi:hypothetical protein
MPNLASCLLSWYEKQERILVYPSRATPTTASIPGRVRAPCGCSSMGRPSPTPRSLAWSSKRTSPPATTSRPKASEQTSSFRARPGPYTPKVEASYWSVKVCRKVYEDGT